MKTVISNSENREIFEEIKQGLGIRKWLSKGGPDLGQVVRAGFSEEVSLELRSKQQERTNIIKFFEITNTQRMPNAKALSLKQSKWA